MQDNIIKYLKNFHYAHISKGLTKFPKRRDNLSLNFVVNTTEYPLKNFINLKRIRNFKLKSTNNEKDGGTTLYESFIAENSKEKYVSAILLAGGTGKRMGANIPKQFLKIGGREVATFSMVIFSEMPEIFEIVIVCDPSWRYVFEDFKINNNIKVNIKWALPGKERQDSVYNGLMEIDASSELVAIHDSARPFVKESDIRKCIADAAREGAAVLGVRVKPTIKQVGMNMIVTKTLDRSMLWEIQTPQIIKPNLLKRGFEYVNMNKIEVTDDASIVEALNSNVIVTEGSYTNIKLTTPDDLIIAEKLLLT